MKKAYLLVGVLPLLVAGCKSGTTRAEVQPPPGATAVSDGGFTWVLGQTRVNGTNVPAGDIQVRALPDDASR